MLIKIFSKIEEPLIKSPILNKKIYVDWNGQDRLTYVVRCSAYSINQKFGKVGPLFRHLAVLNELIVDAGQEHGEDTADRILLLYFDDA